mmetsp:Transcript_2386/g.2984  ORF Transcript_2386/g.2984 Transcript_2386/m.2984 type:complete len:265 (-) Transcript_2386:249-1043(-)
MFGSFLHNNFSGLTEPSDTLAVLPFTLTLVALLGIDEHAHAVLHIISPVTCVLVTIGELHVAITVLLTVLKSTIVLSTILVNKLTMAFEDTIDEVTFVHTLRLGEVVLAFTVELAFDELAFIPATIFPFVAAVAFFLSEHIITSVFASLTNDLSAVSVLLVIEPATLIGRNLGLEHTVAIGRVLMPLTLVHITSGVSHTTNTLHHIDLKHTFVDATVLHLELANTISDHLSIDSSPLSIIDHAISDFLVILDKESLLRIRNELL